MTSIEKARCIIEQGGACDAVYCDWDKDDECPCYNVCQQIDGNNSKHPNKADACKRYLLEQGAWPTPEDTQAVKDAVDKLLAIQAEEASKLPLYSDTQQNMQHVLDSMKDLLIYKNNKYGNSALEPMDVFTRHVCDQNTAGLNSILVRLDDKLKRIQNAEELRKNDVSDLIGYLTLLCVDQEWTDFSEFKD